MKKVLATDNLNKIPRRLSCSCWLEGGNRLLVATPWERRNRFRFDKNEKLFWSSIDGRKRIKDYFKKDKSQKKKFLSFLDKYSRPEIRLIHFKEIPTSATNSIRDKKAVQIYRELLATKVFKRRKENGFYPR